MKLSKIQKRTLSMMEIGIWYSAYDLKIPIGTLRTLRDKKILESRQELGSMYSPQTEIKFRRIR